MRDESRDLRCQVGRPGGQGYKMPADGPPQAPHPKLEPPSPLQSCLARGFTSRGAPEALRGWDTRSTLSLGPVQATSHKPQHREVGRQAVRFGPSGGLVTPSSPPTTLNEDLQLRLGERAERGGRAPPGRETSSNPQAGRGNKRRPTPTRRRSKGLCRPAFPHAPPLPPCLL